MISASTVTWRRTIGVVKQERSSQLDKRLSLGPVGNNSRPGQVWMLLLAASGKQTGLTFHLPNRTSCSSVSEAWSGSKSNGVLTKALAQYGLRCVPRKMWINYRLRGEREGTGRRSMAVRFRANGVADRLNTVITRLAVDIHIYSTFYYARQRWRVNHRE